MPDWATITSAATAGGTLILAVATFASTRTANQAARIAERSLQVGLRPLLLPSRFEDPVVKVNFLDEHLVPVRGGMGAVDEADGNFYMVMSVRNAGSGLAILHGWFLPQEPQEPEERAEWASTMTAPDPEQFRRLNRDIYVAGNDVGFWQGALRDSQDPCYPTVRKAVDDRIPLMVDLLYGDQDGGQRTISRFRLTVRGEGPERLASVARHWFLDRADPR